MNTFNEYLDFLIEIQYSNKLEDSFYKKIFLESDFDDSLVVFMNAKIDELGENLLKLSLILKKYDTLDKSSKNKYLMNNKDLILKIFFDKYKMEENVNDTFCISQYLVNFNAIEKKRFLIKYYLENHETIGNPFGLIDVEFLCNANIERDFVIRLLQLGLDRLENIDNQENVIYLEKIFEICEKKQIQDLKQIATKKIVDYFYIKATENNNTTRNFFVQYALKYIDYYGVGKKEKNKDFLNLVLDNVLNINNFFEEHTNREEFELDGVKFNENLKYFEDVGCHQAFYELASSLFKLYDYKKEISKELNIIYHLTATIAYDDKGIPIYTIDNNKVDDVFFHEKSQDIQVISFLFSRYIKYIRNNCDFSTYIQEFYLPNNLKYIRELDILEDFKNNNYYGFFSQMLPIIENHFRFCLGLISEPYIRPNGIGGYDYLPMKAFLDSEKIREKIGINAIYILKLIFDDRRGLNYRNKLAHGIINPESINEMEVNLVFLTLVFISYFEQQLTST